MTRAKAYVDGFLYMEDEQNCAICGELTNRVKVETSDRQCMECDDVVVVALTAFSDTRK